MTSGTLVTIGIVVGFGSAAEDVIFATSGIASIGGTSVLSSNKSSSSSEVSSARYDSCCPLLNPRSKAKTQMSSIESLDELTVDGCDDFCDDDDDGLSGCGVFGLDDLDGARDFLVDGIGIFCGGDGSLCNSDVCRLEELDELEELVDVLRRLVCFRAYLFLR